MVFFHHLTIFFSRVTKPPTSTTLIPSAAAKQLSKPRTTVPPKVAEKKPLANGGVKSTVRSTLTARKVTSETTTAETTSTTKSTAPKASPTKSAPSKPSASYNACFSGSKNCNSKTFYIFQFYKQN
ncbi:hypothetical protein JTB14_019965 [Gonioctena quinquepunctata]|nr:hypothetical protein JTB14_019965 [Gonioctena quinquepunctata]